ncbi:carotenoid biosynthesis protein [Hymenobacter rubripertinctus]|uniref:Carotenoid biosynthesis protein n=1 Tax=Hymenobacter rubripertinctus TaxID=2029981 RepID=A0A418R697_9BACT|nr:carotenoid biosynthesis protein [Hymenobacter rubripertinctus]RIY12983.1 carotenoid biosynthesis protein [Hymenobacter rubripertinctus]
MPDPTYQLPAAAPADYRAATQQRRLRWAQGVLLLFHVTGFAGLAFSKDPSFFLRFMPVTMLLTLGLLLAFQPQRTAAFWSFCVVTMLAGFFVEVVGIRTNLLFGQYAYGSALGVKWLGVPLLIGVNWLIVTYTTGILARYLPLPNFVRALVAAVLMVGLDICIEPVAIRYDFWHWQYDVIPLLNFKGWFAVSLILQVYFNRVEFSKRNPLAPFVYLVQLLFFFGLGMLL